jgi:hypothetical protein
MRTYSRSLIQNIEGVAPEARVEGVQNDKTCILNGDTEFAKQFITNEYFTLVRIIHSHKICTLLSLSPLVFLSFSF